MLARSDHDFVLSQPRSAQQGKGRRKPAEKPSRWMAVLRALFRNPGRTVVGAAGTALSVAIAVNAMLMQGGPHPAPFFRPPVEVLRPAPLPPARPTDLIGRELMQLDGSQATALRPIRPGAPLVPGPAVPVAPTGTATPTPLPRDPIADVLKGQPGGSAEVARTEPNRAVTNAQRALNKLNYGPVKPDGLLGAGTKQAIERFERDHRLPVTGELAPRTVRELATASGIPQD
jgi:hypothetical protein